MYIEIKILPGTDKGGIKEPFDEIVLKSGDIIAIVGPTGSGKTTLLNDIDIIAQRDTSSNRIILINDKIPNPNLLEDPSKKLMVMITQHTNFLADMRIKDFLITHIQARKKSRNLLDKIIDVANLMTGEKIEMQMRMTELSGGQSRALMIADAVVVGDAPILLLDEVENAGILKSEALEIVKKEGNILFFATHDPVISLHAHLRLTLKNGSIYKIVKSSREEELARRMALTCDQVNTQLREKIRAGEVLIEDSIESNLRNLINV